MLCYCGIEDLFRASATGVKAKIGFDFVQLNIELSSAVLVAACWLLAAQLTGVTGAEFRYDTRRVLATWLMAALPAFSVSCSSWILWIVGSKIRCVPASAAAL